MRVIALFVLCFNSALAMTAQAAEPAKSSGGRPEPESRLSCEQLGEIAQATVQYRDQGQPLAAVLAEADRLEATGRYTRDDITLMRVVIHASFRRDKAPHEILIECKEQRR